MGFNYLFNFSQVLLKMDCVMLILLQFLYFMYKQSVLYDSVHATSYAVNMCVLQQCPPM